ncbi:MAG: hypothetical protein HQL08_04470 [Nitrospirae bacterium]|nr:hypothetical protein [Nitrospirota bacterium]
MKNQGYPAQAAIALLFSGEDGSSMKFSLETEPPAITDFLKEEAELHKRIKKTKSLQRFYLVTTIIIFSSGVVVIFYAPYGSMIKIALGLTIFIISYLADLASLFFARHSDIMTTSLKELYDIPINNCEEALMLCGINGECEKYRQDVVRQGRKMVYGELLMMRAQVPAGSKSYDEAKEKRLLWACTKLHS